MPGFDLTSLHQQGRVSAGIPTDPPPVPDRLSILGCPVDDVGLHPALALVSSDQGQPFCIFDINPEKVCLLAEESPLRSELWRANLVLADGVGIVIAARILHGRRIHRLTGADLMDALCAAAPARGDRIFLLGAAEPVNSAAADKLRRRYPGIRIVGRHHGFFDPADTPRVIEQINSSGADILFVALGSPLQEQWIADNLPHLRVKVCQAVGGAFDIFSGRIRRAPKFLRSLGLEWAFRLVQQPSRLRRQLRLAKFALLVLRSAWRSRRGSPANSPTPAAGLLIHPSPNGNWDAALPSAAAHGVAPLLFSRVRNLSGAPGHVLAHLKTHFDRNLQRNLVLSGALLDALAALDSAGIRAIPFKGLPLAWSVYENPGLRQMDDVDVLLSPEHVPAALDALAPLGWRPAAPLDPRLLETYRQLELFNDVGIAVELHWALMPAGHPFSGDPSQFLDRAVPVSIAGRPVPTLAPQDLLPYLCLHGCRHKWESFKWVCDIALLAQSPAIDWQLLWAQASAGKYTRPLSIGLCLARDLLGADLPPDAAPRDPRASALAARIRWNRPPSRAEQIRFQFRCAEGVRRFSLAAAFLRRRLLVSLAGLRPSRSGLLSLTT